MSEGERRIDRREFVRRGVAAGAGAAVLGSGAGELRAESRRAAAAASQQHGGPLIITSHTNETGQNAMRQAWEILGNGGVAMDAVERGANVIESDPEGHGVGIGGLPNERGVELDDACCMDGRTYNAGSVGALENIENPASVARLVMERTDHIMLVGKGALEFALSMGFEETDLLTEEARRIWVRWREEHGPDDDWGPPDHLRGTDMAPDLETALQFEDGTTNVLAVDSNGDVAGVTTTSGLSWKAPGRVGDSPIIGAGLYVDNAVGAAGCTGRGEDVIKSCASYYMVMRMRDGRTPQEACEDAADLIVEKYQNIGLDFVPSEEFKAISRSGEVGACRMGSSRPGAVTVYDGNGLRTYEGTLKYPR